MDTQDNRRFLSALSAMGLLFSDPVEKPRQKLYWELFLTRYPGVSIDEWEEACWRAMEEESFHKVPLPVKLMDYVETSRNEARRELYNIGKRLHSPGLSQEERDQLSKRSDDICLRLSGLPRYTWLLEEPEERR